MNHDNFTEVTSEDAPDDLYYPEDNAWALGYNTCLERTNAAELLEALITINGLIADASNLENGKVNLGKLAEISMNAIKKATDENK